MTGQVEIPLETRTQLYPDLVADDQTEENCNRVPTSTEILQPSKRKWAVPLNSYVRKTVVPRRRLQPGTQIRHVEAADGRYKVETDGLYEDEYTCFPPPFIMIIISAVEIAFFLYDAFIVGDTYSLRGPVAKTLIYNPYHRSEVWRYMSYMLVHVGAFHLIVNLLVQILLGVPLEMVHRWWRVLIIYLVGVMAGSLATSITDPHVFLAGASGGVYALIAAHVATIILNWSEMEYAAFQMLIFLVLATIDIGNAVYNRHIEKFDQIGYTAHLAGAVAGLLVGLYLLRNLEVKSHERFLFWAALLLSCVLFGVGIVWNIYFPGHWM